MTSGLWSLQTTIGTWDIITYLQSIMPLALRLQLLVSLLPQAQTQSYQVIITLLQSHETFVAALPLAGIKMIVIGILDRLLPLDAPNLLRGGHAGGHGNRFLLLAFGGFVGGPEIQCLQ
ncbi:hypothetical protein JB92DRAFT_2832218 [Gautieria morchelliformis]|nr:hypothetical protein JB92DRAFT_2832218 [Gautieria morchelliformis]